MGYGIRDRMYSGEHTHTHIVTHLHMNIYIIFICRHTHMHELTHSYMRTYACIPTQTHE